MAAEKSVIVQGKSIDEALQRAALLLHTPTTDLAHEVLQQGLVDQKGVVRIPYKLRVLPIVSPPAQMLDLSWPEEVFAAPFSRRQLTEWSNAEYIAALQSAIANQPESNRPPSHERKPADGPTLEIKGDLTSLYGSISHDGDVVIRGNVGKGVNITSAGSVTIGGDVDVSQIESVNEIEIAGALLGIARSTFGGVSCRFAQGAYIEAKSELVIAEYSMHCNLISGTSINVGAAIVGGTCTAPLGINAKVVGSETGVVTRLSAGSNGSIRQEADIVRRQASQLVSKLGDVTSIIKEVEPHIAGPNKASVEDRLLLWEAMSEKAKLNDRLVTLSRLKSMLLSSIDQNRTARIRVQDTVYPHSHIEIDDVGMSVKKLTQFVTFSKDYEAGALRLTSYR